MDAWRSRQASLLSGEQESNNASETVTRFFELISMWCTGLFSNKLYRSTFGLSRMKEITIKPFELKVFATSYEAKADEATKTIYADFLKLLEKFFEKTDEVIEHFVLSEGHLEANPLFLRLKDSVLVSPHFAEFSSMCRHAILDKEISLIKKLRKEVAYLSQVLSRRNLRNKDSILPNQGIKNKMQIKPELQFLIPKYM